MVVLLVGISSSRSCILTVVVVVVVVVVVATGSDGCQINFDLREK